MNDMYTHSDTIFNFPIKDKSNDIIKVIGVGGGGGNAVKNMYSQGIANVSFAICNTDSQALANTGIPVRIQLGTKGLGVGGNPEKGREAAEQSIDDIKRLFDDHTQMVLITAGMGGGTGTGASPVIASVAKEMGILTIGVVTLPFAFEKRKRIKQALRGMEELKKHVDTLLVINNERLPEIYPDLSVADGFLKADEILTVATKCITEIITIKGVVNRDYCDVETVMRNGGNAIITMGRAHGEHRIMKAMSNALDSPLMGDMEIEKAKRLLYIVYTCDKSPIRISELTEVNLFMDSLDEDVEMLWGLYEDNTLGNDVKVTIIATGFDQNAEEPEEMTDNGKTNRLFGMYYPGLTDGKRTGGYAGIQETDGNGNRVERQGRRYETESIPSPTDNHLDNHPACTESIHTDEKTNGTPPAGKKTRWLDTIENILSAYTNE
ncbi:MAG: cell division protein FtsZ [Bacteroides sp.]|nr:cell division protein FtsZ [Roseburia sp.]MCM1345596.1 cell division protein FtsZ [Bacteroides sp.]MCM1420769.1 cell division protein FtsZ [Bacteroides sp.]